MFFKKILSVNVFKNLIDFILYILIAMLPYF